MRRDRAGKIVDKANEKAQEGNNKIPSSDTPAFDALRKFIKPYPSGVAFGFRRESAFFNLTVKARRGFTIDASMFPDFSPRNGPVGNWVKSVRGKEERVGAEEEGENADALEPRSRKLP